MNWNCNPKQRFDRNHLERCYTTSYENNRPVKEIPAKREKPMSYKRRPSKEPYWNFWRAVFAGWLIRYPGFFFKSIMMSILGVLFLGILVFSPDTEYNTDTPAPIGEVRE